MALRRPRFKPTAILSARRPATTCAANIKNEPKIESDVKDEIKEEGNEHAAPRRIIKPSVCLPVRKRDALLRADDLSPAEDNNSKEAATLFKSPIMSPSMQVAHNQSKSVELSQTMNSPVFDQSITTSESDVNINHLSPAKLRQRIRPTPWFGNRRNSSSQNGYLSEPDDEPLKRQRHLSTSSNHSIHCGSANIKTPGSLSINSGRMRTESACSNLSDIVAVREARYIDFPIKIPS